MSTWAYACRPLQGEGEWWVARERIDEMPPGLDLVLVQVDGDWVRARVDRRQRVAVDGSLLRQAVPAGGDESPGAQAQDVRAAAPAPAAAAAAEAEAGAAAPSLTAAAISLAGRRMVVVLVPLSVLQQPGEADMLAADLRARFGGVDIVLMGQADDGTPRYHGDAELCTLLLGVPVDRMPWKSY
ncbi:MAG: hypothetical protein U1F56_17740 [Rubrivivax sp.]